MDADRIKDFIVYNFEKFILGLVVLMSGFLIYTGFSGNEDITKKYDPEKMVVAANEVREQVDEDHTEEVIKDRRPNFDIDQTQKEGRTKIIADAWIPNVAFDYVDTEGSNERRMDPELSKPAAIQAVGVIASMAFRSRDGEYDLATLEPADEVEKVEVKVVKKRPSRQEKMMMMMGGGEDMDMGMGMDMEYENEMMMEMMGGGMGGTADVASGPVRKLKPDDNLGYKPVSTRSNDDGEDQPPVPGIGYFIAGAAAIPHKEIIESYRKALSNASQYDPRQRDFPDYIDYQVQRADISEKTLDQLVEEDWVVRDYRKLTVFNAASYWSGFSKEIVPADYRIPGTTMWIPPVMLDDNAWFSTHPLIPMLSQRDLEMERLRLEAEARGEKFEPKSIEDFELDNTGNAARNFGGMGMGMDMDMGMDMGMDMEMMGMGGMGMGGPAMGMAGKAAEDDPVDYKLLRFYDFVYQKGARPDPNRPRPGRTYVYRIRFAVNDPNFPEKPELQPLPKSLSPDVYTRISGLIADAQQNDERKFRRWSDWSEISSPVSLPSPHRSTVGPVKNEKAKWVTSGQRRLLVENQSPKAEVVASQFNSRFGVFVPTRIEAVEGTVLSKKAETADVVDPITLEIKKMEDVEVVSSATIIDIEGGAPLSIVDSDEQTEPGMFLMLDADGNLKVRRSTDDQRVYRIRSFAEERGF